MFINDTFELDNIFTYEKEISQKTGFPITNLSYWNASPEYKDYMLRSIIIPTDSNLFNYQYSYDIPKTIRHKILYKLGVRNIQNKMCLLTSSSTNSIINIINYLKLNGYHKICILNPSYFSVEQACKIFNFSYEKKSMSCRYGEYTIPVDYILKNNFDAIWLTSPIYSTSIQYDNSQIAAIYKLIEAHILVIADESLALPGQELCKKIPINQYFFAIYSPHKPLFINSIKFSAIVCPLENDDFLEQWIDVLGGALLQSNLVAIHHYLSPNFQLCLNQSMQWYSRSIEVINQILKSFPDTYCNIQSIGPYVTIYIPKATKNVNELSNIQNIISENFVSYIPGIYNGVDEHYCFRVNLSLELHQIENALCRILHYYA